MKIVLIIPASMMVSGFTSGVNRSANSLFRSLKNIGYDVSFLHHNEGVENCDLVIIFQHNHEIVNLINRIKEKQKDIIIFFCPIYDPQKQSSVFIKSIFRFPFELFNFVVSPRSMRLAFDKVDYIISRSSWEYAAIKSTGTKTQCTIIPISIPIKIDNFLEGKKKDIDFLFVGLIDQPRKNVVRLVKAINIIGGHLHLIGKSEISFIENLKKLITNKNAGITYHGVLSDEQLKNFYSRTRVFCLPSLFEGVGQVAMEAYSFGAEIIITAIGGPKDYFDNDVYFVENPLSINEISKCLIEALNSSESICVMNKKFISKYSEDNFGAKFVKIINEFSR
jgi:glycosyltransferase involved in cell wall biosynthesis